MLRGDISNQRSYVFAFRCENSLLLFKEKGLKDKILNTLMGKIIRAEVNQKIVSVMNYIYWNTEYTVMLVINDKNYSKDVEEFIAELPYNQVLNIKSDAQITSMLNTGELTYYIDDCEESRYAIQHKYAITSEELNTLLRRHYGKLTRY